MAEIGTEESARDNETYEQGYWARQDGKAREAPASMVGKNVEFFLEGWDRADREIMVT